MSSLQLLAAAPPAVTFLVAGPIVAYLLLLAVAVLVATLHPDPIRRADASRVLAALLTAVPFKRRP